ncbi:26S protease regulatory subunit 6B [Diplocarpon rosae]|nr:26S protease regulatory subunit 6B [Diplocarpon rosae]
MPDSNKRKDRPGGGRDDQDGKRSKRGSGTKWQTPHQKAKIASRGSGYIEPGNSGIWATCAKGQEGRATEELKVMFDECAERFYGIKPHTGDNGNDEDEDDIEASIQKELAAMDTKQNNNRLFSPVHLDIPCVLFFRTRQPIDPIDFVHRICKEIVVNPGIRRMKYVNRLTPMALMAKASEKGLEGLAMTVLQEHFNLAEKVGDKEAVEREEVEEAVSGTKPNCSYAIRPTTRNHTAPLKRDYLIQAIASSISSTHKVNLTAPDKVIVVEVYQSVCGMSVLGSDWEKLKRFNLAELYQKFRPVKETTASKDGVESKPK